MSATISAVVEPLVRRKIFDTAEEAVREMLQDYILQQVTALRRQINRFEQKYGMRFQQFSEYLHERSVLLTDSALSPEQRQALGQAIMQEEDDWLDWKVAREMLESWLGLGQEVTA